MRAGWAACRVDAGQAPCTLQHTLPGPLPSRLRPSFHAHTPTHPHPHTLPCPPPCAHTAPPAALPARARPPGLQASTVDAQAMRTIGPLAPLLWAALAAVAAGQSASNCRLLGITNCESRGLTPWPCPQQAAGNTQGGTLCCSQPADVLPPPPPHPPPTPCRPELLPAVWLHRLPSQLLPHSQAGFHAAEQLRRLPPQLRLPPW